MNRSCFKRNLTFLATTITLLFGTFSYSTALEATSTLSGHVVGINGKPIAGLPIVIKPFQVIDGKVQYVYISSPVSQTDDAGHFSIPNIVPISIQLAIRTPDYVIRSVKMGPVAVYQHLLPPFGGIAFEIKPGTHIENVEVIVRPRMRIRMRIIFADGTPLSDARVGLKIRHRSLNGTGSGTSSSSSETDDAGYVVEYVRKPGLYTVTVNYRGLSATAEPFTLQTGEQKADVVFTFEDAPISTDSPSGRVEASAEWSTLPSADTGVWVVSPANGHAYKSIHCESWDDANIQAAAEDAHLVAIKDEAEQQWLWGIFGHGPYWIGLTDFAKEGEWEWTSGEPVTYTNWAPHEPMDADSGEEDYVLMEDPPDGKWSAVGPGSVDWKSTQVAIIERDNPPVNMPAKEK